MNARIGFAIALVTLWAMPAQAQIIIVTSPGDPIAGIGATPGSPTSILATVGTVAGQNNYPAGEAPPNAIDRQFTNPYPPGTKYLNFAETNVGLIVTPSGTGPVIALQFITANDSASRDPVQVSLEGTNDANATTTLNSTWTSLYSGDSGLVPDPGRYTAGQIVQFANANDFLSYRIIVTSVRDGAAANSVQFGEIGLISVIPEPSSMMLAGLGLGALVRLRRSKARKPA